MHKEKTKTVNYIVFLDDEFMKAFTTLAKARKYAAAIKAVNEVTKQGNIIKIIREVITGITVDLIKINHETINRGNDFRNLSFD